MKNPQSDRRELEGYRLRFLNNVNSLMGIYQIIDVNNILTLQIYYYQSPTLFAPVILSSYAYWYQIFYIKLNI